ncbi:helix-turn-helix transcriptional regulator [Streptomyces sp. 549]|uniref:helix-turn-helix domain-containing protein n=1 Tax=Streptomyces sp. 549 TaxID=3049076 RepID=UPI0024C32B73|nr:helix-turn-helix transcriptional regulator [Streptomyces sp. 549]MDK1476063.1 helix-turn-helix transcriptional regulator [Streptomyces sp. 549]
MPNTDSTALETVRFGQRLQMLRLRRGMSQAVLAGLAGKSTSWVKAVEGGRLREPGLPIVLQLAEALRVRDLTELTGAETGVHELRTEMFIGPGHGRLPQVRDAINALPMATSREAPPTPHLRARLAAAWAARHSSPGHREVVGALLPELIRDAQLAVRQSDRAADRRAAQAALSEVYSLAQFFLAHQPDSALLWRVAERAMVAALESEDPHTIGVATWLQAEAHRDAGQYDAADQVTTDALSYLKPHRESGGDDVRAIAGALEAGAGYTAARRGDTGTAWGWWDRARRAAEALPQGYYHPVTSFSVPVMGAHGVTLAVELRAGQESVRQATQADAHAIPSCPRRARHRIEEARAHQLAGQAESALATLERAHASAPETVQWNGYARRILLEESESRVPSLRQRAAALAVKCGVLG